MSYPMVSCNMSKLIPSCTNLLLKVATGRSGGQRLPVLCRAQNYKVNGAQEFSPWCQTPQILKMASPKIWRPSHLERPTGWGNGKRSPLRHLPKRDRAAWHPMGRLHGSRKRMGAQQKGQ